MYIFNIAYHTQIQLSTVLVEGEGRNGTTPTALIQKWKQPPKRLGSFLCFAKMSKWTMNLELQDGSYGSRHENAPLR